MVFLQICFKISSRHELHHNCQLILDRDAFKHLYNLRMLCLPKKNKSIKISAVKFVPHLLALFASVNTARRIAKCHFKNRYIKNQNKPRRKKEMNSSLLEHRTAFFLKNLRGYSTSLLLLRSQLLQE